MTIQNSTEGVVFADLPEEPALEEELSEVTRLVGAAVACDVVMDFSQVTVLSSTCLAALLRLRNHLQEHGGRLVLCNIGVATRSILSATGLAETFETAGNKLDALAAVRNQVHTTCG
jgi:anti-anti-sigma factor